jgi:hypothetical protein
VNDTLTRIWENLVGRIHGPFSFRFRVQPLMAPIYATRDGILDACQGRPPYLWSVVFTPAAESRCCAKGETVFGTIHPFELVVIVWRLRSSPM